jgi:chemotaxis protein methyltransferase CheR
MNELTDTQFEKFCDLTYRESGIKLTAEKRELLNARIGKRLRVLSIDAGKYVRRKTLLQPHFLPVEG